MALNSKALAKALLAKPLSKQLLLGGGPIAITVDSNTITVDTDSITADKTLV